mmetsp:Transcript_63041/g.148473  ORF Transcript_63041/g.148473 Transcript_63041/m.148473 type:complete len:214 (-) Transcript_63041:388-1029(-)
MSEPNMTLRLLTRGGSPCSPLSTAITVGIRLSKMAFTHRRQRTDHSNEGSITISATRSSEKGPLSLSSKLRPAPASASPMASKDLSVKFSGVRCSHLRGTLCTERSAANLTSTCSPRQPTTSAAYICGVFSLRPACRYAKHCEPAAGSQSDCRHGLSKSTWKSERDGHSGSPECRMKTIACFCWTNESLASDSETSTSAWPDVIERQLCIARG